MKKTFYILITFFSVIILFTIIRITMVSNKIDEINKVKGQDNYSGIFTDYFDAFGELPISIDAAIDNCANNLGQNNIDVKEYFYQLYNDPFTDRLLKYIPLKDSHSNKYFGFILLSSGSDRIINNDFNDLQLTDFESNLELINSYNDNSSVTNHELKIPLIDKALSKKGDIFVYFWSIPQYYLYISKIKDKDLGSTLNRIYTNYLKSKESKFPKPWLIKSHFPLIFNVDSLKLNENKALYSFNNFEVECSMLVKRENLDLMEDHITIVGLLDSIGGQGMRIYFKNCLQIPPNYYLKPTTVNPK